MEVEGGEWRLVSGEWRVGSGEWRVVSGDLIRSSVLMLTEPNLHGYPVHPEQNQMSWYVGSSTQPPTPS